MSEQIRLKLWLKSHDNLNSHSWDVADFFQILWVWLGPPDNTLNQEYYVELSRSVYIQKIKMIRHVFHKILQTCYFPTLSMFAKTYLKFRHQSRALLEVHWHAKNRENPTHYSWEIVDLLYVLGHGQTCQIRPTKKDTYNL